MQMYNASSNLDPKAIILTYKVDMKYAQIYIAPKTIIPGHPMQL